MDAPILKRRRLPKLRWLVAAAVALAAVAWAGWHVAGRKVWTDGRPGPDGIRAVAAEQSPRQVLWAPPHGLELNSADQEYEPALSPDGTELYFVRGKADGVVTVGREATPTTQPTTAQSIRPTSGGADLYVSHRRDNAWTPPVGLAAVNSPYDDLGPRLTPDGKSLLFYSSRPGGLGGYDLWAAARLPAGGGWAEPVNLGPAVNSEFDEYSPAPSPDGKRLFFSTNRTAASREQRQAWRATLRATGTGDFDLWVAGVEAWTIHTPGSTASVLVAANARAVPNVNTPSHEGASCLSPQGDFLYFASNRPGGLGKFDLYRSRLAGDAYGEPENLGPAINTADNETDPQLALGGFRLYFSSDRRPVVATAATTGTTAPAATPAAVSDVAATPAAVAGADAGYDIYESDSREVYPERQAGGPPTLAWTTWLAILGLVALVPLLWLIARMDRRKLTLLQKCLLVAMLLHAAMLVSFREVAVQLAPNLAKKLGFVDITISIETPESETVGTAVRRQSTTDLPGSAAAGSAEPSAPQQYSGPTELLPAPTELPANVPQATVAGGSTVYVAPPTPPAPSPDRVRPMPPVVVAPAMPPVLAGPAILPAGPAIDLPPKVETSEATPPSTPAAAADARRVDDVREVRPPSVVAAPQMPAVRPAAAGTIVAAPSAIRPATPTVDPPRVAAVSPPLTPAPLPATPPGPPPPSPTAAADAVPSSPLAVPQPVRVAIDAGGPGTPAEIKPVVPVAGARTDGLTESMAAAPGMAPLPVTGVKTALVGVTPTAPGRDLIAPPDVPQPSSPLVPVVGGEPAAPSASQALAPGVARSDVPADPATGGAGDVGPKTPPAASAAAVGASPLPSTAADFRGTGAMPSTTAKPSPDVAVAVASPPIRSELIPPTTRPAVSAEPSLADAGQRPTAATTRPTATPSDPVAMVGPVEQRIVPTDGTSSPSVLNAPAVATSGPPVAVPVAGPPLATPSVAAASLAPPAPSPIAPSAAASATSAPEPVAALPAARTTGKTDVASPAADAQNGVGVTAAVPTDQKAGGSIADAINVAPRPASVSAAVPKPTATAAAVGPTVPTAGVPFDLPSAPVTAAAPIDVAQPAGVGSPLARAAADAPTDRPAVMAFVSVPSIVVTPGVKPMVAAAVGGSQSPLAVSPQVSFVPGPAVVGGPKLSLPEPLSQRAPEQRRPVIEKLGGTKASEDAVDRGLAYLARVQEPDGRWTYVGESPKKKAQSRPAGEHDMALTGLSVLAFLAADHSPAKEGPYRQAVASAVDWMVEQQGDDGDLRGAKKLRGGGAAAANMYDHGIATMAVAEAALMTGDRRYADAAMKAARFICDAQNPKTGGWRYVPGDPGDTSVFGWQVMALHNAELLGFQTPPQVRERAVKFLTLVSSGRSKVLAGYTPGEGPTPAMTAEALFCRTLLGQPIDAEGQSEVSEFLTRDLPKAGRHDLYFWYYASLSLSQMQASPRVRQAWDVWNARCRDALVGLQAKGGDDDGSWTDPRWGGKGAGRVFSTAVATLTLEVYYRYLPMQPGDPDAARAAWQAAEPPKKPAKPKGPVGPKFEAN